MDRSADGGSWLKERAMWTGAGTVLVALGLSILLASVPATAGSGNDGAKVALAEAIELIEEAGRACSLEERWTLYERAHAHLRRIVEGAPDSALARRLDGGETVNGVNYLDMRRALLRTGKAVCEQNFTAACVLRLAVDASRVAYPARAERLLLVATRAQAAAGDVVGALTTAEELSPESFREALPPIMAAMVRSGDLEGALSRARSLYASRDRDAALSSIVRALAEDGDVTDGRRVAEQITDTATRALAVATLAHGSKDGAGARAALFGQAVAFAESVGDSEERASLLFEIARLQLSAGDTAQARETVARALAAAGAIGDALDRSTVLAAAVYAFSTPAALAAAPAIFDQVRDAAARLDEIQGAAEHLLDSARARINKGDIPGADALLREVRRMALGATSEELRDYLLQRAIQLRSEIGDIEGALTDSALLRAPGRADWARQDIARAQARAGDVQGLRRLLDGLGKQWRREHMLRWHVIPTLAENGWLAEARAFASQITESGQYREEAMVAIAKGEAARGGFDAALTTARSLRLAPLRARALREIAAEHLARSRLAEARAFLKEAFRAVFRSGVTLPGDRILWSSDVTAADVPDAETLIEIGALLAKVEARQ